MIDAVHPADRDTQRLHELVRELLHVFPHPDTGRALPGLLGQAWTPSLATLTVRQSHDTGAAGKPGSRPPMRLDLASHCQDVWDAAHRIAADDLGCFLSSDQAEESLRRIPQLIEGTFTDCRVCARCVQDDGVCECRHRTITHEIGVLHSTIRTALGWQEPRLDWIRARCPQCEQVGKVSVRGQRVWCRQPGCRFDREGTLAVLSVAA